MRYLALLLVPVMLSAQIPGTPPFAAPQTQSATTLNGTSQYWTGGNASSLNFERTDAFSVLAVAKWTAVNNSGTFAGKAGGATLVGWSFFISSANSRLAALLRNSATTNEIVIVTGDNSISVDGKFHLVAFTYDGSSNGYAARIYLDGDSLAKTVSVNNLSATIQSANHFGIGARISGTLGGQFSGSIGQTVIVKKALSADEVKNAYTQWKSGKGLPKTYGSGQVVGYWDWKAGGNDKSGQNNHLTPVADPGIIRFR